MGTQGIILLENIQKKVIYEVGVNFTLATGKVCFI
jgi:hypothetical protein